MNLELHFCGPASPGTSALLLPWVQSGPEGCCLLPCAPSAFILLVTLMDLGSGSISKV